MPLRYCFDIFDTLLMRLTGGPRQVFAEVARQIGSVIEPEVFAERRTGAEKTARKKVASAEITLDAIYAELAFELAWDSATSREWQQRELSVESQVIIPVPRASEMLAEARSKSPFIVFATDMYLPSDYLRGLLVKHGFWREGDVLLVSGEQGCSKHSGGLFQKVRAIHPAAIWHHVGNDPIADIAKARAAGFEVRDLSANNPTLHEAIWQSHSGSTGGLAGWFAGASRVARLSLGKPHDGLVTSTTGVMAPLLTAFVLCLLKSAQNLRLPRLYFIARDGQVLFEIAEKIAPQIGYNGELRYLYGGRRAWYMPSRATIDDLLLRFLLERPIGLTLQMVADRIGTTATDLKSALAPLSLPDCKLSEEDVKTLREALESPKLEEFLSKHATRQREAVLGYFAQEGLLDGQPFGIVDSGWTGKSQSVLDALLAFAKVSPPEVFYIGKMCGIQRQPAVRAWLFDEDNKIGAYNQSFRTNLWPVFVENACKASDGTTLSYELRDGRWQPILSSANTSVTPEKIKRYREAVMAFVEALPMALLAQVSHHSLQLAASEAAMKFYEAPSPAEALEWMDFKAEVDPVVAEHQPWVKPYTWADVKHVCLNGCRSESWIRWQQGSLAATPPSITKAMNAVNRLRSAMRRIRRILTAS